MSSSTFRIAFWLCALVVLVLALLPPGTPMPTTGWDKSNHMLAFATLALLAQRAWPGRGWPIVICLVGYGVMIEWLQSLTPYRDADAIDVVADSIGVLLGLAVAAGLRRARRSA